VGQGEAIDYLWRHPRSLARELLKVVEAEEAM